jgi:outer membrane receptor protein involved in Fe transport
MTAIRQPLTTNPVYLYLEDGVPTRSTGFFNHNALYEINVPQADGIEVSKGPGTVLYGSDAIGGVVNVLTRRAPEGTEAEAAVTLGEYGFGRLLASAGHGRDGDGLRLDLNHTQTDGWRDATDYDRDSVTLRLDNALGGNAALKSVLAYSHIDQQTAGSSALSRTDYETNPTRNTTPISFREVTAARLSSAWEREDGAALWSLTPYARFNDMDIIPNWSLSYDPTIYNTQNSSLGLLAKYRRDFADRRARLIAGLDLDHSPGSRFEQSIAPVQVGGVYTSYSVGATRYDYDVTYESVSPYVHGEWSASERTRLSGGLRYDAMRYDYENHLGELTTTSWKRPASQSVDYRHLSPKLGLTHALTARDHLFAGYSHGFRAPSESQLFRQGSAVNTVDLDPVKADQVEVGYRGRSAGALSYEVSLYQLTKTDDILSFRNPVTGLTEAVNAGETRHRGVELGLRAPLTKRLALETSWSYAVHTYEEWLVRSGAVNVDYSGNEIETAPRVLGNTRLAWRPAWLEGGRLALEWMRLGSYWEDAANTQKYEGHDLLHLRANLHLGPEWELFASVFNLTDTQFAESASYTVARGEELAPGLPRTLYAGVRYRWRAPGQTRAVQP